MPHPLFSGGEQELCLLTKSDKTTSKELLESKGVKGVTKVGARTTKYVMPRARFLTIPNAYTAACAVYIFCVLQVIPVAKLKTHYKTYESKRQLSASYDVFLTDKRIYQMLPRLLGKKFFEKKKSVAHCDHNNIVVSLSLSLHCGGMLIALGLGGIFALLPPNPPPLGVYKSL